MGGQTALNLTVAAAERGILERHGVEILGARLNTIHNLHYYLNLMQEIRDALDAGRFEAWRTQFHADRARGI